VLFIRCSLFILNFLFLYCSCFLEFRFVVTLFRSCCHYVLFLRSFCLRSFWAYTSLSRSSCSHVCSRTVLFWSTFLESYCLGDFLEFGGPLSLVLSCHTASFSYFSFLRVLVFSAFDLVIHVSAFVRYGSYPGIRSGFVYGRFLTLRSYVQSLPFVLGVQILTYILSLYYRFRFLPSRSRSLEFTWRSRFASSSPAVWSLGLLFILSLISALPFRFVSFHCSRSHSFSFCTRCSVGYFR